MNKVSYFKLEDLLNNNLKLDKDQRASKFQPSNLLHLWKMNPKIGNKNSPEIRNKNSPDYFVYIVNKDKRKNGK